MYTPRSYVILIFDILSSRNDVSLPRQYSWGPRQFFQDFDLQSLVWPTRCLPFPRFSTVVLMSKNYVLVYLLSSHNMSPRKGWFPPCRLFLVVGAIMAWVQTTAVTLKVSRKREYHCIAGPWRPCYKTSIIICDRKIKKLNLKNQ